MDCPEIRELAVFAETQHGDPGLVTHLAKCDACQEAMKTLQDEVQSLQIPLSEIWFREHISCPHTDVLADFQDGKLDAEFREYVKFHVEDLGCAFCQARLGEAEVQRSREGKRGVTISRKRVIEVTAVLRDELRKKA